MVRRVTAHPCPLCQSPTTAVGLCPSCVSACAELEEKLLEMEAHDPKLKAAGDRLRDLELAIRGEHSRFGVHERSVRRIRKARMKWRSP